MKLALHDLVGDWIKNYDHFMIKETGGRHGLMCDCPIGVLSNIMTIQTDRAIIYDISIYSEEGVIPEIHKQTEIHAADEFFFDKLAKYMRYHCAIGRSTQNMA